MLKEFDDGVLKYREQAHNLNELEVIGVIDETITNVEIPDYFDTRYITAVGEKAFCRCKDLEIVYLGNNIRELKNYAFAKCFKLREIHHMPLYLAVSLRFRVFADCRSLQVVDINIGHIGTGSFQNCVNLEKLQISGMCLSVEDYAFNGCSSLSKIVFLASIHHNLEIYPMTFFGGRIEELHIERNVTYNDKNIMLRRDFEDYFNPATKIYCPAWSNLTDLCFVGRKVIIEEICI